MKFLEKALYTVGGLVASGLLAFNVACSSPSPTPTRAIPLQTQSVSQTPLLPTATPVSLDFVEVYTGKCKRKITLLDYSRRLIPNKEGWELVTGELKVFNECPEDSIFLDRTIIFGDGTEVAYMYPTREGYVSETLNPSVRFMVKWKDGDEKRLTFKSNKSTNKIPYTPYSLAFNFEIPRVVPSFEIAIFPTDEWWKCSQIGSCVGLEGNSYNGTPLKYRPADKVKVTGIINSNQTVDSQIYSEWLHKQMSPFIVRKELSIAGRVSSSDAILTVDNIEIDGDSASIKLRLENKSYSRDIPVNLLIPQFIQILTNDGSHLDIPKEYENKLMFHADREKIPPGYSATGQLQLSLDFLPHSSRYVVFYSLNKPLILDLKR